MKKILVLFVIFAVCIKGLAQTTANRKLPLTYIPGGIVSVKIDVNVAQGVSGVIVKEFLPQDWVVSETMLQSSWPVISKVEQDPENTAYKIYSWVAFGTSIPSFWINYKIFVPLSASGDYQFYGRVLTIDNPMGDEISGDSILRGNIGDINSDGTVDISDVILCLRMAIGLNLPDYNKADINKDSVIDISDVILILRIAIGII